MTRPPLVLLHVYLVPVRKRLMLNSSFVSCDLHCIVFMYCIVFDEFLHSPVKQIILMDFIFLVNENFHYYSRKLCALSKV